jgi:hypothetical protein
MPFSTNIKLRTANSDAGKMISLYLNGQAAAPLSPKSVAAVDVDDVH